MLYGKCRITNMTKMKAILFVILPAFILAGQSLCFAEGASIKASSEYACKLLKNNYGFDEIVFARRKFGYDSHWYANIGYYADTTVPGPFSNRPDPNLKSVVTGGQLCKLNFTTGEVTVLIDEKLGTVRDPVVHYDAKKILFSYRKGANDTYHLWEINIDGSGLKQLTDGIYDDIEPVYLPDGGIMFVSSRARRWVNCWMTQVATLHRCDGDGKNMVDHGENHSHGKRAMNDS